MDEWTHWARDVDPDPLSAEQMIPTEPLTLKFNAENFRIDILSVIMLGKKRIFFGLSGVVTCLG